MARICVVCAHPQRDQMRAEHIGGRSARAIAKTEGRNIDFRAVHRCMKNHLPAALSASAAAHLDALDAAPAAIEVDEIATGCTGTPADAAPSFSIHVPRAMVLDDTPAPQVAPQASIAPSQASSQPSTMTNAPSASPAGPVDLWQAVHDLRARGLAVLTRAETAGDDKLALGAMRELRGIVETLARLTPAHGGTGPETAYAQTSEWGHLRAVLLDALAEYPDARLAVATALAASGALT